MPICYLEHADQNPVTALCRTSIYTANSPARPVPRHAAQMVACTRIGGGCLITVRDYDAEERGTNLVKPYGVRVENGHRYLLFQVWDFVGAGTHYDLRLFFVVENLATGAVQTHVMRSRYHAVSTRRLCELMREAGLDKVERLDGVFYQPVLVGTRLA